ncbi:MAG: hypothetical protein AAF492_29385, partial [Verrucomicrobiota bacterium]
MTAPLIIIYITSFSHSGSTLLDLLISSHHAVTSMGEAKVLSRIGSSRRRKAELPPLEKRRCACGERTPDCPFWTDVDRYLQSHHELELSRLELYHEDAEEFRRHNQSLFEAVSAVSQCHYLVDLSKDLGRLRRLREAGFDVRPIHLVRSPHGVVFSQI